jgi:hypothetical protein
MNSTIQNILWNQFGASIDMLINVIARCPEDYFITHRRFYYIAYHSTLFLDYYLTIPPSEFSPKLAFTQIQKEDWPAEAIDDLIPNYTYTVQELVNYLKNSREKCQKLITTLTEEGLQERFQEGMGDGDMDFPILEILLYNMRHTQHHAAQLNLLIRQDLDEHREWSFRVGDIKIE